MIFLVVLIFQVSSFEYLSAIVHSQDVSPIPHRNLWHPHLYLAKDSSGEYYEIRHSSQYYDVSISFLQTSDSDSAPGVMNCECRFVKEEEESEEETTFLQVMTPSKVKPKNTEPKDKEISIGAYVPKSKEQEFKHFDETKGSFREDYSKGGPEIIVVQGFPQQPVYNQQPVYTQQPGYNQPVYTQSVYTPQSNYGQQGVNGQGYVQTQQVNYDTQGNYKIQGNYNIDPNYNTQSQNYNTLPQNYNTQTQNFNTQPQNFNTQPQYNTQPHYNTQNNYNTQPVYAQTGYNAGYTNFQSQEYVQQPSYVPPQNNYVQPMLVPSFSQNNYKPQEYPPTTYVQGYRPT